GGEDPVQGAQGQPLLEDQRKRQGDGTCAADHEVVDGAVHGERTDVASRKEDGAHHVGVGGEGDLFAQRRGEDRLIVEGAKEWVVEGGEDVALEEAMGELSAAAVAYEDPVGVQDRKGTAPVKGHRLPPWRREVDPRGGGAGRYGSAGCGGWTRKGRRSRNRTHRPSTRRRGRQSRR